MTFTSQINKPQLLGPFGNLCRGGPGAPGDGNLRLGSAPADPPAYSGLPRLEQAADGGEGAPGHSRMQKVIPWFVQFAMLVELTSLYELLDILETNRRYFNNSLQFHQCVDKFN